jgi:Na+/melibiose symporter-like transporter
LNSKMMWMVIGALLIIIALILGAVRYMGAYDFGVSYGSGYGWYFYGLAGVIGLIGIILAAWSFMKTEQPKKEPAQ